MRELGYTEKWDKLKEPVHTTWRLPRKDTLKGRDWHLGEVVKCVYRPRSPKREFMFIGQIIKKEPRTIKTITNEEAKADGFGGIATMVKWLMEHHKGLAVDSPINKLTIRRVE